MNMAIATTKGEENMSYETKVILTLLAQQVGQAKSLKEAYTFIVTAANVEGFELPTYEEFQKKVKELEEDE